MLAFLKQSCWHVESFVRRVTEWHNECEICRDEKGGDLVQGNNIKFVLCKNFNDPNGCRHIGGCTSTMLCGCIGVVLENSDV